MNVTTTGHASDKIPTTIIQALTPRENPNGGAAQITSTAQTE